MIRVQDIENRLQIAERDSSELFPVRCPLFPITTQC
jgi:hypothetical protein